MSTPFAGGSLVDGEFFAGLSPTNARLSTRQKLACQNQEIAWLVWRATHDGMPVRCRDTLRIATNVEWFVAAECVLPHTGARHASDWFRFAFEYGDE
ncbi:MAG: hypothetical protein K2Y37_10590 [Pirellulales bacterium]|nr:hypothetical protein [Pirellulales bacterium]